ncbi:type II secretion system protein E [Anaeromyxobacter dehalogenans 2CP-1]|uniref:Type II secretion system protein E n=1 Tax=Anaeromyxobacter dehalogenans (strain ATCC BAA-258 / DSM 21875 / 2CP-1) TaxID=455488 RepID=B8JFG7_ANAD2|nr:CpaF family protein [Anaeromyxobacter dehalogenans]ACL66344.1 type II secretion system protein E [Anaeromyxobacter dehalogenans 2CP-1]
MRLSDRLRQGPVADPPQNEPAVASEAFRDMKGDLHRRLVDRLDLKALERLPAERLQDELRGIVAGMVSGAGVPLNQAERDRLVQEILDEVTGLGPLEPLLADGSISDILVNTAETVYVERNGKLELTRVRFDSNDHLMQVINRIVSRVGRRVDETSPMVDARLPDGSRVNAIIPPLAIDGAILSIRRFGRSPLRVRDLLTIGSVTREAVSFLAACVTARLNVLVSGGTGSGKTTMLNALSAFIPPSERIVTIEDSAELQLQQPHVVRLETRPPNIEGKGEIIARDLVRNSLRMRPDRIIVGEVRSSEVLDMLQAMNTGHDGSMTTIHANSPRDALTRLEAMIAMGGIQLPEAASRQMISRAINIIVQLNRGADGHRRLVSVGEITGTEGPTITMQEIFRFDQKGVDERGKIVGQLVATGIRPKVMNRIQVSGIDVAHILDPFLQD